MRVIVNMKTKTHLLPILGNLQFVVDHLDPKQIRRPPRQEADFWKRMFNRKVRSIIELNREHNMPIKRAIQIFGLQSRTDEVNDLIKQLLPT